MTESVEITRETDASRLNKIVNDQSVFKWVSVPGVEYLDASEIVANPNNVLLMGESGGVLYIGHGSGLYEAHSQYLPEARGSIALETTKKTISWMFENTDCTKIISAVPRGNFAAAALAKACGLKFSFEQPDAWPTESGMIPVRWFEIDKPEKVS